MNLTLTTPNKNNVQAVRTHAMIKAVVLYPFGTTTYPNMGTKPKTMKEPKVIQPVYQLEKKKKQTK